VNGSEADRDQLLTADDVAELMRVTRAWVYAETRRDRLPHLRLGRHVRYRRAAIEAWMRTVERGPSQPRERAGRRAIIGA
jgi:excisionase family DNA binding protein